MLVTVCGSRDAPHARATRVPGAAIIIVGCDCGPLKALFEPLFATLDALPTAVDGDIRWRSLTIARGHLPASLGWVKHDSVVASGILGGDAVWCHECVPIKVAMLTLERALCAVLGWHARAPQVSLMVGLWLGERALPPQCGLG
jgi:hypothetical protein